MENNRDHLVLKTLALAGIVFTAIRSALTFVTLSGILALGGGLGGVLAKVIGLALIPLVPAVILNVMLIRHHNWVRRLFILGMFFSLSGFPKLFLFTQNTQALMAFRNFQMVLNIVCALYMVGLGVFLLKPSVRTLFTNQPANRPLQIAMGALAFIFGVYEAYYRTPAGYSPVTGLMLRLFY